MREQSGGVARWFYLDGSFPGSKLTQRIVRRTANASHRQQAQSPLRRLQGQRRGDAGAGRRPERQAREDRARRRRATRARSTWRAASCCRATASSACSTPARRSSRSRRWPRSACTGQGGQARAGAGMIAGIGRVSGRRVHDRLQRRHGEGRHLLPDDGQEAPARAGDRRSRTACPASTWSTPAAPTCRTRTRSSPTATTSAASSTTRPT